MDVHPDAIRFLKNSRLCEESCRSVASEAANFVALAQDFVAVRHGWESSPRNFVANVPRKSERGSSTVRRICARISRAPPDIPQLLPGCPTRLLRKTDDWPAVSGGTREGSFIRFRRTP